MTLATRSTIDLSRLQHRAISLRRLATSVDPILANSYRRRASELELELWIHVVRCGLTPEDSPLAA
ncbi:unannotated protein [freshwater metagenome]|jgi:hypothetical protein|uniref:Unannotated protein n=1 Tax=freshwater metagenome TaxID=449393 RepID=A0A6J6GKC7_9ZZZZ|nr:hypothetical protein [Actinomycetota bacterium]